MNHKSDNLFWKLYDKNDAFLQRMAKHLPNSITPNFLTFIRIMMAIPIILAAEEKRYLLAALLFLIAYSFDLIDGPLARVKNQITEFGKVFDPAADKIVFLSVLYFLGKEYLPAILLYAIFILELLLVSLVIVLKPIAAKLGFTAELGANIYGKVKMFFQTLGIVTLLTLLIFNSNVTAAVIIFAIAACFSVFSILGHLFAVRKK